MALAIGVYFIHKMDDHKAAKDKGVMEKEDPVIQTIQKLAGRIAHDFNNLLAVMTGYAELIERKLPPQDPLRSDVGEILKAGEQAKARIRQLLTFSGRQRVYPETLDINDQIKKAVEKWVRPLLSSDIELVLHLASGAGKIKADLHQFEQLLLDLATNARDAMPETGRLTIETQLAENRKTVLLLMTDTGQGMTEEVKARLFEPLFSTKRKGESAGLGLGAVDAIVKQMEGRIEISSEPGRGTTVKIFLPRLTDAE